MVAIARAVSTAAGVVIMDEPTSSLEPREVDKPARGRGAAEGGRRLGGLRVAQGSTRCSARATPSRCCATGGWCTPGPPPSSTSAGSSR
nr:hypothetical protein [Angustibacter aerolatus]